MPYALSRKLRRDVRANCNEHFRPARENDIIVSRFSGIGDAERWLATFCNWGSQESLSGNRRLSCVLAAMTNNASTVFGNSPEGIETWRNFLHLFREKYLGHKKPWSGTKSLPYVLLFGGSVKPHPGGHAGIGAILISPTKMHQGIVVSKYLGFNAATNNSAEYLALVHGLQAALNSGVRHILVHGDSQLVIRQVSGMYEARKPHIQHYLDQVLTLTRSFESFQICHIPRVLNNRPHNVAREAIKKNADRRMVLLSGNLVYR